MQGTKKALAAWAITAVIVGLSLYFGIPLASTYPLEIGVLLYFSILIAWRPFYVPWSFPKDMSDFTELTFSEALNQQPVRAVSMGLGIFIAVLMALTSILVQTLHNP